MNFNGNVSDQKAIAGFLYGMNPKTIVTKIANDTIGFGRAVYRGDGETCSATGAKFAGVSVYTSIAGGKYVKGDSVNVMEEGYLWVPVSNDTGVDEGKTAYIGEGGAFAGTGTVAIGVFKSGVTLGGSADEKLALVYVNAVNASKGGE